MSDADLGARRASIMILDLPGPFDLALSLEAAAIFYPEARPPGRVLQTAVRTAAGPALIQARQLRRRPARVEACASGDLGEAQLDAVARRLICADLDLRPFYDLIHSDPVMGPVAASMYGLKPLQPATAFEAAVIAVTEQQLSMAAAYRIRSRMVRRFGDAVGELWTFPGPEALLEASDLEMAACGLSRQKIGYIKALADDVTAGRTDLERMRADDDDRIRERLFACPGFGRWSVEHVLLHGFCRPGALPATDVNLQKVVGHYLAGGRRLSADEVERALDRFKPCHGLAAFYLSVHRRRQRDGAASTLGATFTV